MPPGHRKKVEDESPYAQLFTYAASALEKSRKAVVAVLAPSVHAYFWWCTVIYLICGIILAAERGAVHDFFCSLPPQEEFGGQGCTNCPATLLMCQEGTPCYKAVMNITYHAHAKEPEMQYHQVFIQASTDLECNKIIMAARTPLDALKHIEDHRDKVEVGCVTYHCKVLKESIHNSDLVNLDGGDTCTNEWGAKGWGGLMTGRADECVCQTLITDPNEIDDEIKADVDALCPNLLDSMCNKQFYSLNFHWCGHTLAPTEAPPTAAPAAPAATPAPGGVLPAPAAAPTATSGPGTSSGGASSTCAAAGDVCGSNGFSTMQCCSGTCMAVVGKPLMYCVGRRVAEAYGCLAEGDSGCSGAADVPEERRLADLKDWEVSRWGECTCYQQCIPGVRHRNVDCLSTECKDPVPATKEACECNHCARCMIDVHLTVLEVMFFCQGGLAFLAFLCYLYINTMREEQLVKLSWARWFMGIICKRFPPTVKYLVLSTAITLVLMWCRIWIPQLLSTNRDLDCWMSRALTLVSIHMRSSRY